MKTEFYDALGEIKKMIDSIDVEAQRNELTDSPHKGLQELGFLINELVLKSEVLR
jgi:hypothetical protein